MLVDEGLADMDSFDTDVVVIGSGFGGSVAALRFSQAGERVVVLERGPWVTRESFVGGLDFFWMPHRNRFGMNDLRSRGKTVTPWVGAGVGGGSLVYAGTLKRLDDWTGFPATLGSEDLGRWYDVAEQIMRPSKYPDWSPYADNRTARLLYETAAKLRGDTNVEDPVVDAGAVELAISFAPPGVTNEEFINVHGAPQRYHHPYEQAILGGDIDAKNSLDKNYLHLAQARGAEIRPMCEAERIEPLPGGGYRINYKRWISEPTRTRRWLRRWLPRSIRPSDSAGSITARRVVLAAGCVGSTELLLRSRDHHRTLPSLSPALGRKYTTNGNFISLMLPFRGVLLGWLGFLVAVWAAFAQVWWLAAISAAVYLATMALSRGPFDPDLGTTNSDYIRFRGPDGKGSVFVESGRYPTPERLAAGLVLSMLSGYRPHRYREIVRVTSWVRSLPPFSLLARSWPIPLLQMGRDNATGHFELDPSGNAIIQYDTAANHDFYAYLDRLGKRVAKAAKAYWFPNGLFRLTGKLEVSHNQGGVPMGEHVGEGVVDHAGRVFGYDDLMVLDGSIIPVSPGPNPAFTILAIAERAMSVVTRQIVTGPIRAEVDQPNFASTGT